MKIVEYICVIVETVYSEKINRKLEEGYEIYGFPVFANGDGLYQIMVKYDKEKKGTNVTNA